MTRWIRGCAAALALALLPLQGCSLTYFTLSIPDLGSKDVRGVWLWRLSPVTGQYERDTQFVFTEPEPAAGDDLLSYTAVASDGSPAVDITTYLIRDPENPDRVTLQLVYGRRGEAGFFRASTYNQMGDSPLTNESIPL